MVHEATVQAALLLGVVVTWGVDRVKRRLDPTYRERAGREVIIR